jgi:type VI secretion system protein ImpL
MIRRLLFILFLYALLVWIIAAYFHSDDVSKLVKQGLLWTGIGVAALFLWLIVERVVRWWQIRRSERAARPAQPVAVAGPQKMHPDDLALLATLREAEQRLSQAPIAPGIRPPRIFELPMYLVLGPERAGKTSLVQSSGVEPALLAGQIGSGGSAVVGTRLANVWIAQQTVFIEIGGKIFSSDARRFAEFLANLSPKAKQSKWRRWLQPSPPANLRGVLLVFDAQKFTGTPEPSELDREAQQIRERLFATAATFGPDLPVYTVFSKLNNVKYFQEFFGRMADTEAGQLFGVLTAGKEAAGDRIWAESETKRLSKLFSTLFLRLSDRRLAALAQETRQEARAPIYEFPREFKRIRTNLVQFLVDVFKPDPLQPSPQLRGFFFIGTRRSERMTAPPALPDASVFSSSIHASDATQIFSSELKTSYGKSPLEQAPSRAVEQWMFVPDLFTKVLRQDRPAVTRPPAPFDRYRTVVTGVAVGLALLITLVWTVSWFGNSGLVSRFQSSIDALRRGGDDLSLANLRALDTLRVEILEIQKRSPFRFHWGLYTGNELRGQAKRAYFGRLRRLTLRELNEQLASQLQHAGDSNGAASAGLTYDRLKTHRTITTLACPLDEPMIARVLKASAMDTFPKLTDEQRLLLNIQIDYYASELGQESTPPVALAEDPDAEAAARAFLRQAGGLDQQLNSLLAAVDRQVKPIIVGDYADKYQSVLSGPSEIRGAFTKEGLRRFEDMVAKGNFGAGSESCVMGDIANIGNRFRSVQVRDQLLSMYYSQYADSWRTFLAAFHVLRYSGPADAARRLDILAGSTSPLLAIVRLVSTNTDFAPPKPGELSWWERGAKKFGLGTGNNKTKPGKGVDQREQALGADSPRMTTADLARLFQPVQFTTPAEVDRLVNDNDSDYVKGLRGLQSGLDALGRASATERATAIPQAQVALNQARASQTALADKFYDVGNVGLNKQLATLLEQPIRLAAAVIPSNAEVFSGGKKNSDLAQFCHAMSPILSKYPFNQSSQTDATLTEVAKGFSPLDGFVWKYVQQSASDLVVKQGSEWKPNPSLQGMKVAPELLRFLTGAQELTDVFFAEGGLMQPRLRYVLRPVPGPKGPSGQTIVVRLILDGKELNSQDPLQKTFYWPAPAGSNSGAEGTVQVGDFTTGFGRFEGLWGVLRLFQNADGRTFSGKVVQWSEIRGLGKSVVAQPLNPPAKVEFVEFPGGKDLFNPVFFESLQCPRNAVTVN